MSRLMGAWRLFGVLVVLAACAASAVAQEDAAAEFDRLLGQAWDYYRAGKYEQMEAAAVKLKALAQGPLRVRPEFLGHALTTLGDAQRAQGRYAEAEEALKQAMAIYKKSLPPDHPDLARSYYSLGNLYSNQGRYAEAEEALKQAMAITKKSLPPDHPDLAGSYYSLGNLYRAQGRYAEAEEAHKQAMAICKKSLPPDHPHLAMTYNNLGILYRAQGRYAEAEEAHKQAMAIYKKSLPRDHPYLAMIHNNLGILYSAQGRYAEAEPLLDQAIAIADRHGGAPELRFRAYWSRARLLWSTARRQQALADLKQALDSIEWLRVRASGEELQRAEFFAGKILPFELMVSWQTELGDAPEVLSAMERSRARTLLEQMETQGMDLLAGLPQGEAARLRRAEQDAQGRAASLQKQLDLLPQRKDLSAAQRTRQEKELETQLRKAQQEYSTARADVRNSSPAYRLAVGQDRKPVGLDQLGKRVAQQDALVLEYLLGTEGSYLLVVPAGGKPRVEKVALSDGQAKVLGVEPGALTAERLAAILTDGKATGLLQLLRANNAERLKKAAPRLAVLWEVLIPEAERKAILEGKYKRLIVIPDGALAQLPFETLVVGGGERPMYLLDVGPPILYAPSATILMNLADRPEEKQGRAAEPVLTVGDCRYSQPAAKPDEGILAQLTPRSRYGSVGGRLRPLEFSEAEVKYVAQVFGENDVSVAWLKGDWATEATVRDNVAGRRVLHFACHGLVDQAYGNLFGALALTPGEKPDDPSDDGFLTLAEVYGLNLKGCELTILSACDTNVGPEQRGEGVWALSRGFLVAGSRRVVASNWLVDDEAAATLVSYFCSIVAAAEKEGKTPDYAQALLEAKRYIRQQDKWKSPYYWGTFVLIGPN